MKDNIATKTLSTTAASRILSGYNSPFDATVARLLEENGATISCKTNLDEFGMGSHSQNAYPEPVLSLYQRSGHALSPGGSSGGSVIAVATGESWAALGTDTGGSVRLPAAYTGIVGFKPSYGLLSRWGVIQYANSLDTVGIMARRVGDVGLVFNALNQYDARDPTSLSSSFREGLERTREPASRSLRIGVPLEYNIEELASGIKATYMATLKTLLDYGHSLVPVSIASTRQALSAYYVLAPAEASSNLVKYDGIRYGRRSSGPDARPNSNIPLYTTTRAEGFGDEVKRRILLGAYTLSSEAMDNYFVQAQKVRRLVQSDFNKVFKLANPLLDNSGPEDGVDVLLTPTAPTLPPTIKQVKQSSSVESFMNDVFTVPASLAGLPAISVPVPFPDAIMREMEDGDIHSGGMQVIGQFGDDHVVLQVAEQIQKMTHKP